MARPIALMFVSVLAFIVLLTVRGWAEEKSAAPRISPDDPAAAPFMLEQRPLPGSLGGGGGVGMGKGRVGPGSAPIPDAVVAEYLDAGRYAELARLFRERLEFLDATAPGRDPRIATVVKNLGLVYQLQARFEEAAALYERALELRRRVDGDKSAATALAASQLATVYQALGRLEEAERLHLEAVRIFEQIRGPEPLDTGLSLNNLAHFYLSQRKVAEARELFQRALRIFERVRGPIHSDVALAHTNLALCAKFAGDNEAAHRHFTRAIEIFAALGPDRPELAIAQDNLAGFLAERGLWGDALAAADSASEIVVRQVARGSDDATAFDGTNAARVPWNEAALARYLRVAWEVWRANDGVDAALLGKAFRRAQWISQTSTAKALTDMAARQATGDAKLAALARRRQDMVAEWQRLDRQLLDAVMRKAAGRDRPREQELRARLDVVSEDLAVADRELAQDFPDYAALASPRPLSIAKVQSLLADDEASAARRQSQG
jgi:tetratricopeptide (TPR) repeat protein